MKRIIFILVFLLVLALTLYLLQEKLHAKEIENCYNKQEQKLEVDNKYKGGIQINAVVLERCF